jgi:hypothetical protein
MIISKVKHESIYILPDKKEKHYHSFYTETYEFYGVDITGEISETTQLTYNLDNYISFLEMQGYKITIKNRALIVLEKHTTII